MSEAKHPGGPPESIKDQEAEKGHPAKPAKDVKKEPATFHESCADLSARLDAAASSKDADEIEACWKDLDALTAKTGDKAPAADQQELAALSARFHHFAPRKLAKVKSIEAALDAGIADKGKAAKTKVEHPAVTKAKADLAALHTEHASQVMLPEDEKAIKALEAKIAAVPLVEES